jgi:Peptidase family M28
MSAAQAEAASDAGEAGAARPENRDRLQRPPGAASDAGEAGAARPENRDRLQRPPGPPRRRPRRGSLERPISARTYRGTWLLVALPLLVAAFSVARPVPLPAPDLPAAFDTQSAAVLADQLASQYPDRSPGTAGSTGALRWVVEQLRPYGFKPRVDRWEEKVAGHGTLPFANVIATAPGRSNSTIVVLAHRDNSGASPGANDNASGTAALIELARSYANPVGASGTPSNTRRVSPTHRIVFVSTDGGTLGGIGALHYAHEAAARGHVVAVIDLDAIAGAGKPRLEFAGDTPRTPSLTLVATAAARVLDQSGTEPQRPSGLRQLLDLAFPFSFYEQAPFVGRGISAITLTSAGDRPPSDVADVPNRMHTGRMGQIGRSAQQLLASLDEGVELAEGTTTYIYLGSRAIRGWAIELVLIACLLPFLAAAVDLFALCRRRRIPLAPALRSFRSRFALWLWVLLWFELLGLLGVWAHGAAAPPAPAAGPGTDWPVAGVIALAVLSLAGWLIARDRLLPRGEVTREHELAGHTAAMLVLAILALLIVALNPFVLVFLLPAMHAWLWLPQARRGGMLSSLATYAVGLLGPALVLVSFAFRFQLGFDALWYLAQLAALGYVNLMTLVLTAFFAAAAAQVAALSVRRYAPYPDVRQRPPLGPGRRLVRRVVLTTRARRRARAAASGEPPAAIEG